MSDAAHKMPTAFDVDPDPTTILSLSDDTTMLILSHAGFASLLALKLVSRCFSTAARATLLSSSRWATARHLCAGQSLRDAMSDYASTLTPCKDNRLATAFLAALRADDVRTIEVLLHQGLFSTRVPVSSSADDAKTSARQAFPLHFAHSAAMVALLCVHGAQVDARSSSGSTPLMEAAHAGEVTVVLALCEHGANVHLRNGPASSAAIHQAENCDMRCHFLRTKRPPEASLWRLPLNEEATAASRRLAPDGGACVRVLLRFGAARIL